MTRSLTSMLFVLVAAFLLGGGPFAVAQQGDPEGDPQDRDQRRGFREGRRGGPEGWRGDFEGRRGGGEGRQGAFQLRQRGDDRGRFAPRRPITPEERAEMYDRMAQRYLDRFGEQYEVTDDQRAHLEAELEKARAEHEEYIAPLREEADELMEKMRRAMERRREGETLDREEMREAGRRLYQIRSGSPLMNFGALRERLESRLPDEQVEVGRRKQEERRERMREFWNRREGDPREGGGTRMRDSWERYFDRFVDVYDLDESQKSAAGAIFRNYTSRRDAYLADKKDAFAEAENLEDRDARREQRQKLNAPVDEMFTELRAKLDQIPTAAQKEMAEAERAAQTRPARERAAQRQRERADRGDREVRNRERRTDAESPAERTRGRRARN